MATPVADRAVLDKTYFWRQLTRHDKSTSRRLQPSMSGRRPAWCSTPAGRSCASISQWPRARSTRTGSAWRDPTRLPTCALRVRLNLLAEDIKVSARLLELLETVECTGKQAHDANVVATMLVHGIDTVVTMNVDDFARFGDHVHVADLHP